MIDGFVSACATAAVVVSTIHSRRVMRDYSLGQPLKSGTADEKQGLFFENEAYAPWRRAQQRFKEVRVLATLFATDLGWSDAYADPAVYSDLATGPSRRFCEVADNANYRGGRASW